MKNIERIIESQYPPRQTNVAWKDINENTLKFYVDGEWKALKDEDFRQKQADWNQADNTKEDFIKNKPSIPDAQIQSDWNQTNVDAADYIKNKPNIPSGGGRLVLTVPLAPADGYNYIYKLYERQLGEEEQYEEFLSDVTAATGLTEEQLLDISRGYYDSLNLRTYYDGENSTWSGIFIAETSGPTDGVFMTTYEGKCIYQGGFNPGVGDEISVYYPALSLTVSSYTDDNITYVEMVTYTYTSSPVDNS